jgi:fatty-acyl-CoA synthase
MSSEVVCRTAGQMGICSDDETSTMEKLVVPFDGTLVSVLMHHAADTPDKVFAYITAGNRDDKVSYRDLLDDSLKFAALYKQAGALPGDIVMIFLMTHKHMFAAFLGAMLIGGIPTYMPCPSLKQDPDLYWRNHRALFERTKPGIVLTDADTAVHMASNNLDAAGSTKILRLDEASVPLPLSEVIVPSHSDVALLQHSSGTTGLKKGVMLTYQAIGNQIEAYSRALAATPDDIIISWLPVYHDMGLIACTLMPLVMGQTVVVLDPFEWASNASSLFHKIAEHRGTLVWLPNFAFEHLVRSIPEGSDSFDLSSIRAFINCSESCKPATFARFTNRFSACGAGREKLQVCYAMAETVFAATQTQLGEAVSVVTVSDKVLREERIARAALPGEATVSFLSTGKPIDGTRIRIASASSSNAAESVVGEVLVSGNSLFNGYYELPDASKDRLVDSEYHTRDLGFILDGELYVLGRVDDVIIVHGKNFYAHEIEMALSEVPGIRPGRAVAFGIDNPMVGSQDLVVVAEHADGVSNLAETRRYIKNVLFQEIGISIREAMLVPGGWLVKTTSGKIHRESNKAKYLEEKSRGETLRL